MGSSVGSGHGNVRLSTLDATVACVSDSADPNKFTAAARRRGRWWIIQCDQMPAAISQVRRLRDAAGVHREAIAYVAGIPQAQVDLTVHPEVDDDIRQHIEQVHALRHQAQRIGSQAEAQWAATARTLHERGWTYREIGTALSVSHQRAYQLVEQARLIG